MGSQPINVAWLKSNGWKSVYRERCPDLYRYELGWETIEGRHAFSSPDDLCIDVAPDGVVGWWYVWIAQVEPNRQIHVRKMAHVDELIRLHEALTGRNFQPKGNP